MDADYAKSAYRKQQGYRTPGWIQKLYEEQGLQRSMAEHMGDIEFQADVGPLVGPGFIPDVSVARVQRGPENGNLQGFRVPENFQGGRVPMYSAGELSHIPDEERDRIFQKTQSGQYIYRYDELGDTVNAVADSATGLSKQTWAHEYSHRKNPANSERDTRILDAMYAKSEEDYNLALEGFADYEGIGKTAANERLISTLTSWEYARKYPEGRYTEGAPAFWKRLKEKL